MLVFQIALGILLAVFCLYKFSVLWPKREEIIWNFGQILMNVAITALLGFCFLLKHPF